MNKEKQNRNSPTDTENKLMAAEREVIGGRELNEYINKYLKYSYLETGFIKWKVTSCPFLFRIPMLSSFFEILSIPNPILIVMSLSLDVLL